MHTPLETVQTIYQAFGAGNIPAILETLAPDVQWEGWSDNSAQQAGTPHLKLRRGPDGAMAFFQGLGELDIHEFKVLDMIGGEHQVAAEIEIEFTVKATGRRMRDEELHLWSFGPGGKVTRMRHYVDTAKHAWAAGVAPRF